MKCIYHKEPYRVDKPWGYELWWGNTNKYLGKLLFIRAGHQSSVHYHNQKAESMYVHAGIMKLEIYEWGDENELIRTHTYTLGPGEAIDIPPKVIHSIRATADLDLFEASTPHPEDSIRVRDRYERDS